MIGLCALASQASADDDLDAAADDPTEIGGEVDDNRTVDSEVDGDEVDARSSADVESVLAEESIAAASGLLDTTAIQDVHARHQRPSRLGRLDLAVAWRIRERIDNVGAEALMDPNTVVGEPRRRGELWLLLTWRN